MNIINLNFSKSFLLEDFKNSPEGGGIYFHYIVDTNGLNRIIYVGECQSFRIRQEDHYLNYLRNKCSLFKLENDGLNIIFIPEYDLYIKIKDFELLKEKLISSIYVICSEINNLSDCNLKGIEGAIINYLYRKSEIRKYLLNTTKNYTLRNAEIFFTGMNIQLSGLTGRIETPNI